MGGRTASAWMLSVAVAAVGKGPAATEAAAAPLVDRPHGGHKRTGLAVAGCGGCRRPSLPNSSSTLRSATAGAWTRRRTTPQAPVLQLCAAAQPPAVARAERAADAGGRLPPDDVQRDGAAGRAALFAAGGEQAVASQLWWDPIMAPPPRLLAGHIRVGVWAGLGHHCRPYKRHSRRHICRLGPAGGAGDKPEGDEGRGGGSGEGVGGEPAAVASLTPPPPPVAVAPPPLRARRPPPPFAAAPSHLCVSDAFNYVCCSFLPASCSRQPFLLMCLFFSCLSLLVTISSVGTRGSLFLLCFAQHATRTQDQPRPLLLPPTLTLTAKHGRAADQHSQKDTPGLLCRGTHRPTPPSPPLLSRPARPPPRPAALAHKTRSPPPHPSATPAPGDSSVIFAATSGSGIPASCKSAAARF